MVATLAFSVAYLHKILFSLVFTVVYSAALSVLELLDQAKKIRTL